MIGNYLKYILWNYRLYLFHDHYALKLRTHHKDSKEVLLNFHILEKLIQQLDFSVLRHILVSQNAVLNSIYTAHAFYCNPLYIVNSFFSKNGNIADAYDARLQFLLMLLLA